jgi:hypothetical protein
MRILAALALTTVLGSALYAQARPQYKVEFDIRDRSEGAREPDQRFTVVVDETGKGSLRATKRVAAGSPSQDVEVGAIIQCAVQDSGGKAGLSGEIELSRIIGEAMLGAISQPIIGQRKIGFDVTVELSSPTVIVDDMKRKAVSLNGADVLMIPKTRTLNEVQVTVTKAN